MRAQTTRDAGAAAYAASLAAGFEAGLREWMEGIETHSGLLDYAVRSGHRTRPVGCLLACEAVGGDWRDALPMAVGVELLHKSSVIRDDIVDEDANRSGQPSFHVAHGLSAAVVISDVLWSRGLSHIANGTSEGVADSCLRAAAEALCEMAAGQLEDALPSQSRMGAQDRLLVNEQKTGSLAGLACQLGAIVGGGTTEEIATLTRYGRKIGTAFQVLNDVRNLSGEENARLPASDIRARRDTVLTAFGREAGALGGPPVTRGLSHDEVEETRSRLTASGALKYGDDLAARLLDEARHALVSLRRTPASEILESLTRGVLRDHAF
jgi:geranylgeranyl diphosphate synthase type I